MNAIARPVVDKEFFEADTVSRTALMLAAEGGNFKMVRLLLHEGADVNARSGDDRTSLMFGVWVAIGKW